MTSDANRINEALQAATGQARIPRGSSKGGQFAAKSGGMRRSSTPGVVGTQRTRVAPAKPAPAPARPTGGHGQGSTPGRGYLGKTPTKSPGMTLAEATAHDKAAGTHYTQRPGYVPLGAKPTAPATPAAHTPAAPAAHTPASPTLVGPTKKPQTAQVRSTLKSAGLPLSEPTTVAYVPPGGVNISTGRIRADGAGYKVTQHIRSEGSLRVDHVGGSGGGSRQSPAERDRYIAGLTARNMKARAALEAKGFETKEGHLGPQSYFIVTGKRTPVKGTRGSSSTPRTPRTSGNLTRKDAVAGLRAKGYTGPVSMSVPALNALHEKHMKANP